MYSYIKTSAIKNKLLRYIQINCQSDGHIQCSVKICENGPWVIFPKLCVKFACSGVLVQDKLWFSERTDQSWYLNYIEASQ